jgi:hypothetical protein
MKRIAVLGVLTVGLTLGVSLAGVWTANAGGNGRGSGPMIYVESQGLCYESIVRTNLPAKGPFQLLEADPDDHCGFGLKTQFGPGDPGYRGGRWVTVGGDHFICPLLGPGFEPES